MKFPFDAVSGALGLVSGMGSSTMTVAPNEDGWEIYNIDPSHTMLSYTVIPRSLFTLAEGEEWIDGDFTVDCDKFKTALGLTKGDDQSFVIAGGRVLMKGNGMTSRFPLELYAAAPKRFPNVEFTATAEIDTEQLRRIVKAGGAGIERTLMIQVTEVGVGMADLTEQQDGITLNIPADECSILEGEGVSSYPMSAFKSIIGVIPKGVVTMRLGTNIPVVLEWGSEEEGDGDAEDGVPGWSTKCFIAPRVEQD